MIYVFKLKKIIFPLAAALLFALFTGIILSRDSKPDYIPTSNISQPERLLIIDAGHGGTDGGAVASNGIAESGINLAIAQKLEATAKLFGIKTLMTRRSEQLDYPPEAGSIRDKKIWDQNRRVEMINSFENAVLISIHQNTYPDPRPSGPAVLYGKISGSDALGELCQTTLNAQLAPESRRLAAPVQESIYLMKSSKIPAILVECGFISNEKELNLLLTDSYQSCIAAILLSCYIQYIY